MLKIVIIWPIFPWRGGIAHHTNHLVAAFIKMGHLVSVFSFSRQYPRFLYPGKDQTEPLWSSNPLPESPNISVHQIIDTINPLSWYRTARMVLKQKPDFCLIKYWHPYFVPCFIFIAWILRRKNIPVICIIDNLFPHERHFGDTFLTRILLTQITGAVTQSELVHKQFQGSFSHIPETMIQHPIYDQFGPPVPQKEARHKLQIKSDKKVLLFFWFIRLYKGLDILLSIMPQLIAKYPNIHLIIAGECFGSFEMYQQIIDSLDLSEYITLHVKYIPNTDISNYFGACDLLVMPYRSVTNSGIENIAKIYTKKYLLTVGVERNDLTNKIINKLASKSSPKPQSYACFSWEEYVFQLCIFLKI